MALSNRDRIERAMDALKDGLAPFATRELQKLHGTGWFAVLKPGMKEGGVRLTGPQDIDVQGWMNLITSHWDQAFRAILGSQEKNYLFELRNIRNDWAHQKTFTLGDTQRALDTAARFLEAVGAAQQAQAMDGMMRELLRQRFEEEARKEAKKAQGAALEGQPAAGLLPWREIVKPHPDVLTNKFKQAEFAADLWQVHRGVMESLEYRDPVEFYRRTYLTEGLHRILRDALLCLNAQGGNPVLELQTNFGGGKTHTMLALYHLFGGLDANQLPGLEPVLKAAGLLPPKKVHRAVLVGTKLSPGQPDVKVDGTAVHTLWGELAWELGGAKAYATVKKADETGTSPGKALVDLLKAYAPCVVLIDEWVAYARQIYGKADLPGGSFDAQFTFAQALTEAAAAVPGALVVISLPQSERELGSEGGLETLKRLKQAIGRIESPWRAASTEEGFEIVRRRLFEPPDPTKFAERDAVLHAFHDLYVAQPDQFPSECREGEYRRLLAQCYPIHPELFERLFQDWSSLERFQRTRGVLRLMATVIHAIWTSKDTGLMILPSSVPLDRTSVQEELKQYLDDSWSAVVEKDVDGPHSLPVHMDQEIETYKRYSATRRVARTLFMGSAPTYRAANKGLEERRIKLGCVQPGEKAPTFGDALKRLCGDGTYTFADGVRYWYSTQASATRLAEDRAERLDAHKVDEEILRRLELLRKDRADFSAVHLNPASAADVPDQSETRLVVLGPDNPHNPKDLTGSPAALRSMEILKQRSAGDRTYRNALVFLAPDQTHLEILRREVRRYLAWKSILAEEKTLNLDAQTKTQAEAKIKEFDGGVTVHLGETYLWVLVPGQTLEGNRQGEPIQMAVIKCQGPDLKELTARVVRKLKGEGVLYTTMGGEILGLELREKPFLWREQSSVPIQQILDDFARYLYLPRLANEEALLGAIGEGTSKLLWRDQTFAYADGVDAKTGRFLGLVAGAACSPKLNGLLVQSEVADQQFLRDKAAAEGQGTPVPIIPGTPVPPDQPGLLVIPPPVDPPPQMAKRFHGQVKLDPQRTGRDAGGIAEAIIQRLALLPDAEVTVTLEISANLPEGAPDHVVRTVTENCRTLKFESYGFEKE